MTTGEYIRKLRKSHDMTQAVRLLDYYNSLNSEGKDRILETAEDISNVPKYFKDDS